VAEIAFQGVSKVYDDGTRAVDALSLDVADGEFLVLVGPSGCGKTTALRMLAGLEGISEGTIRIGDRVVNDVPARDRDLAMVFQSYALYPHLDVFDNIAFGLRLRKVPKEEIEARVERAAETLALSEHLRRRPGKLSGGQRQRVAMGRAMVREPAAFLMDEPLSNLDAKLRVQMRAELARNSRKMGVTTIYVTHDQTEAMTLGHRVAVMKKGVLQQVASPQELYDKPANIFVAGFIGSPAMNLVKARLTTQDGDPVLLLGSQAIRPQRSWLAARPKLADYSYGEIALGIRPEDLTEPRPGREDSTARIHARVELTEGLGSDLMVHGSVDAPRVDTEDTRELARDSGADGAPVETASTILIGRFGARVLVSEGDLITMTAETERLHAFDLVSGQAIR